MNIHYCKVGTVRPNSSKVLKRKASSEVLTEENAKKVSYFSKLAK